MAAYEVLIDHAGSSNFITFAQFIDWDHWSSFTERHTEFESLLRNHFWDDITASLWHTDPTFNGGKPLVITPGNDFGYVIAIYYSKNVDKIEKADKYMNSIEKELFEENKSLIHEIRRYNTIFQSKYQSLTTYQVTDMSSVGKFLGNKLLQNSFEEIKSKGYLTHWAFEIYKPIRSKNSRSNFEKEEL